MTALAEDIARFTVDGIVLEDSRTITKTNDPNALSTGTSEREMFFDDVPAGIAMLDELFSFVGRPNRPHEGVEIADSMGLGTIVPVFPRAPQVVIQDDDRGILARTIIRAYSTDMESNRYAVELVGFSNLLTLSPTFDSAAITFDSTAVTWDTLF